MVRPSIEQGGRPERAGRPSERVVRLARRGRSRAVPGRTVADGRVPPLLIRIPLGRVSLLTPQLPVGWMGDPPPTWCRSGHRAAGLRGRRRWPQGVISRTATADVRAGCRAALPAVARPTGEGQQVRTKAKTAPISLRPAALGVGATLLRKLWEGRLRWVDRVL
jgi:hypothetical protein